MLIDYELLRSLVEVGAAGSFTRAARRRRVTASAISQQMKKLSGQIGRPLFERVGRTMRLTDDGAQLLASVKSHFGAIDEAVGDFVLASTRVRGVVRVAAPAPFYKYWLRPRIVQLATTNPELLLAV